MARHLEVIYIYRKEKLILDVLVHAFPTCDFLETFLEKSLLAISFPEEPCKRISVKLKLKSADWIHYGFPAFWSAAVF